METSSENNASFGSPPPYVENQTSVSLLHIFYCNYGVTVLNMNKSDKPGSSIVSQISTDRTKCNLRNYIM